MKGFSLIVVLVALVQWSSGYSAYSVKKVNSPIGNTQNTYSYSASFSSSSSSAPLSSANGYHSCCTLDKFGLDHLQSVAEFANRLRHEYISGSTLEHSASYKPWSKRILTLTGKTADELETICRLQSEQLAKDLQNGLVTNDVIDQSNFFEWKSNNILNKYDVTGFKNVQQQLLGLGLPNFKVHNYPTAALNNVQQHTTHFSKHPTLGDFETTKFTSADLDNDQQQTSHSDSPTLNVFEGVKFPSIGLDNNQQHTSHFVKPNLDNVGAHNYGTNDPNNFRKHPTLSVFNTPEFPSTDLDNNQQQTSHFGKPNLDNVGVHNYGTGTDGPNNDQQQTSHFSKQPTLVDFETPKFPSADLDNNQQQTSHFVKPILDNVATHNYGTNDPNNFSKHPTLSVFNTPEFPSTDLDNNQQQTSHFGKPNLDNVGVHNYGTGTDGPNNDQQQTSHFSKQPTLVDFETPKFPSTDLDNNQQETSHFGNPNLDNVGVHNYGTEGRNTLDVFGNNKIPSTGLENDQQLQMNFGLLDLNGLGVQKYPTAGLDKGQHQTFHWDFPDSEGDNSIVNIVSNWGKPSLPVDTSTTTVTRYNKTIVTDNDGTVVTGSESHKKWVDGKLVYDSNRPIGDFKEWQQKEHENLKKLIVHHHLTPTECRILTVHNQQKLQELANKHNVPIFEVQNWLQNDISVLEDEDVFNSEKPKEWETEWKKNVVEMLNDNDFTVDEFQSWALKDFTKLQKQHNVKNENVQQLIKNEGERLAAFGLFKPNKKLNPWQQDVRDYLENIIQKQCQSIDDLKQRLKESHNQWEHIARKYQLKIEDIDSWVKVNLAKLLFEGQLQIDNLTAWQVSIGKVLYDILKQNKQCTLEEFQQAVKNKKNYIQKIAFQYHTTEQEIEKWIQMVIKRLQQQGKLDNEKISQWKGEQEVILSLLLQDFKVALDQIDFKEKESLSRQYLIEVEKVETYVKEVEKYIKEILLYKDLEKLQGQKLDLLKKRQLEVDAKIQEWQQRQIKNLDELTSQYDLNLKNFNAKIDVDDQKLQSLIHVYNENVHDIQVGAKNAIAESKDLLSNLKNKSEHLPNNVHQHQAATHDLELKVKLHEVQLKELIDSYNMKMSDIVKQLNQQFSNIKSDASVEVDKIKEWQTTKRDKINNLLQNYMLAIKELQRNLLSDRKKLSNLIVNLNNKATEIASWINSNGGPLQALGFSKIQEESNKWQNMNFGGIMNAIQLGSLSLKELKQKIEEHQPYLHQHKRRIEEIKDYIKEEIQKFLAEASEKLEEYNQLQRQFINDLNEIVQERVFQIKGISDNDQHNLEELVKQYDDITIRFERFMNMIEKQIEASFQEFQDNFNELIQWLQKAISDLETKTTTFTDTLKSERNRLKTIFMNHHNSMINIDQQIAEDHPPLKFLSNQFNINIELIEKWERKELELLQKEALLNIVFENLKKVIAHYGFNKEDVEIKIVNNHRVLQHLANTCNVQVHEIQEWLKHQINELNNEGFFTEVKNELTEWQQNERERLHNIIQKIQVTLQDFELKIKIDQSHLYQLAAKYNIDVSEIEEWLKKELFCLEFLGDVKSEKLNEWQKVIIDQIIVLLQDNKLTYEELESILLDDHHELDSLAMKYHVNIIVIQNWIKNQCDRLQTLGLLNNWQKIVREQIINMLLKHSLSLKELEEKLEKEPNNFQSIAHQYHISLQKIDEFVIKELHRLQADLLVRLQTLKDWQADWRTKVINMLQERDFTVEEFRKWLLNDSTKLHLLANQHHVTIEEIKQWINKEVQLYVGLGLLKPNEIVTAWKQAVRDYLEKNIEKQCQSIEELEERLKESYLLVNKLAADYNLKVEQIYLWLKKDLARFFVEGRLQINDLTAWHVAVANHLVSLLKQKREWCVEEFEQVLKKDIYYIQKIAFQYQVSVEEIQDWIQNVINMMLQDQDYLNTEKVVQWQNRQQRIFDLLQQHFNIEGRNPNISEKTHRNYLEGLISKHIVNVDNAEENVDKFVNALKENYVLDKFESTQRDELKRLNKNRLEVETKIRKWLEEEHDNLRKVILQTESNQKRLQIQIVADNQKLQSLSLLFNNRVNEIQNWFENQIKVLRNTSSFKSLHNSLDKWFRKNDIDAHGEHSALQDLYFKGNTYSSNLNQLAVDYANEVSNIEEQIKQDLLYLQHAGLIKAEELAAWENAESKEINDFLKISKLKIEELERNSFQDFQKLHYFSEHYSAKHAEIENWINDESEKLRTQGLLKIENELKSWQDIEAERIVHSSQLDSLSIEQLEHKIKKDEENLVHHMESIREIRELIENMIQSLQAEGLMKLNNLNDFQAEFISSFSKIVRENESQVIHSSNEAQKRVENFLAQHSDTFSQFRDVIDKNVKNLKTVSQKFNKNQEDLKDWLSRELSRLNSEIGHVEQLLQSQRKRLENIFKNHYGSVFNIELQLATDYTHLQTLANSYNISFDELKKWERQELDRLQREAQSQIVHKYLKILIAKYHLNLEEFELVIKHKLLQELTNKYQVTENQVKEWLQKEITELKHEGYFNELKDQLDEWQQAERERLRSILNKTHASLQDLELIIKIELSQLTAKYNLKVSKIKEWLENEVLRMQFLGLVETQEPFELHKTVTNQIILLLQDDKYTIEALKHKLLNDHHKLDEWAKKYNVQVTEIKNLIKKKCQLLESLDLLEIYIDNSYAWQVAVEQRFDVLWKQEPKWSLENFQKVLKQDIHHMLNIASKYDTSYEEIEKWLQGKVSYLQLQGEFEIEKGHVWQDKQQERILHLLQQHPRSTLKEFQLIVKADSDFLENLCKQYNVSGNEVEQYVQQLLQQLKERNKFVQGNSCESGNPQLWQMQLKSYLQHKPQEKPMFWQDFEQFLNDEHSYLEFYATQYCVSMYEIEKWLRQAAKELSNSGLIRDQVVVEDWKTYQQNYLQKLISDKFHSHQEWSIDELVTDFKNDDEHLQRFAKKHQKTVEQALEYYKQELQKLWNQRQTNTEHPIVQQTDESGHKLWKDQTKNYLGDILQKKPIPLQEFEELLQTQSMPWESTANQNNVGVKEIEVVNDLKNQGLIYSKVAKKDVKTHDLSHLLQFMGGGH